VRVSVCLYVCVPMYLCNGCICIYITYFGVQGTESFQLSTTWANKVDGPKSSSKSKTSSAGESNWFIFAALYLPLSVFSSSSPAPSLTRKHTLSLSPSLAPSFPLFSPSVSPVFFPPHFTYLSLVWVLALARVCVLSSLWVPAICLT